MNGSPRLNLEAKEQDCHLGEIGRPAESVEASNLDSVFDATPGSAVSASNQPRNCMSNILSRYSGR